MINKKKIARVTKFIFTFSLSRTIHIFRMFGISEGILYIDTISDYHVQTECTKLQSHGRDLYARRGTSDTILLQTIIEGCERNRFKSEYWQVERICEFLHSDHLKIIDAGANIGLFAVKMKELFPNSVIVAVEPEHNNYDILVKNVSSYGAGVRCIRCGVWSKRCCLKNVPGSGEWGNMVIEVESGKDYDIKAVTPQDLIDLLAPDGGEIDVFKMDIEGSEYSLFIEDNLSWILRCKVLVLETHDDIVQGVDQLVNDKMAYLGYRRFEWGENQMFLRRDIVINNIDNITDFRNG